MAGKNKGPHVEIVEIFETDVPESSLMQIRYRHASGSLRSMLRQPSLRAKPTEFLFTLMNANAELPPTREAAMDFLGGVLNESPTNPAGRKITQRTGWADDEFVMPTWTATKRDSPTVLHQEAVQSERQPQWKNGKNSEWKKGLTHACSASSYIVFAISLALTGPLLRAFDPASSLVFNFAGPPNGGKSTAQRVAESVVHRTMLSDVNSTNLTATQLEELAFENNEMVLCLDDFGAAMSSGTAADLVRLLAYNVREGHGKARSKAGQIAVGHENLKFRTPALTSSEMPLGELAQRLAGEQVRFIDIRVPAIEDGGIFDLRSEDDLLSARELAEGAEETIGAAYGTAFPKLVKALVKDRAKYESKARKFTNEFVQGLAADGILVGQQRRYPEAFGKVFAAAKLAVKLEIVPFTVDQARTAVVHMYRMSELIVQDQRLLLNEAIGQLASLPQSPHCLSLKKGKDVPADRDDIWAVVRQSEGRVVLAVVPSQFERFVTKNLVKPLVEHLAAQHVLLPGKDTPRRQMKVAGLVKGKPRPHLYCLDLDALIALSGGSSSE